MPPRDAPPRPSAEYSLLGAKAEEITVPDLPKTKAQPPRPRTRIRNEPAISTPVPESAAPRSLSPTPWERDSVVEVARAELERHGDKLVRAPESARLPVNHGPSVSLMAQADKVPILRILAIVGGVCASLATLVAAIGTVVVNIITAQRPASIADIERKLEAVEARTNGRFGLDLEEKARQEKDAEHDRRLDAQEAAMKQMVTPRIEGLPPGKK